MKTLREVLQDAEKRRVAVGHFNFSELTVLKAVGETARELDTAVVVGVSESEREFVGVGEAAALVKAMRDEGLHIFLNADHTHSIEKVEEAARAGFGMVELPGNDALAVGVGTGGGVVREQREADGFGRAFGNGLCAAMAV